MAKNRIKILAVVIISGALFSGCAFREDDVTFARKTMEQLIAGNAAASNRIDWTRLTILGANVGQQYMQHKTEKERNDFARSFIKSFSESYKSKGAKASAFFGWRPSEYTLKNQAPGFTNITAYCHDKKSIFFFFLADVNGKKKLVEIMVVQPKPAGAPEEEEEDVATP